MRHRELADCNRLGGMVSVELSMYMMRNSQGNFLIHHGQFSSERTRSAMLICDLSVGCTNSQL